LDASIRDSESGRLIADEFDELMKRRLPHLANDQSAVLIGITDEDMYIRDLGPSSMYNYFVIRGRFGVVSSYLLTSPQRPVKEKLELVRTRVRKLISRDIGIMAFRLPKIIDPTSVVADHIGPADNIDLVARVSKDWGHERSSMNIESLEMNHRTNQSSYQPTQDRTYQRVTVVIPVC
jgi:hypothetical protein